MPHHWPVRNDRAGFRSWEVHMDEVIGGVDTHTETHCAALVDACGRLLGVNEFAASSGALVAVADQCPQGPHYWECLHLGLIGTRRSAALNLR